MHISSPENAALGPITKLDKPVTEIPFGNELTTPAVAVGAGKWIQMVEGSAQDEKERHATVFQNPFTKNFTTGDIQVGTNSATSSGDKVDFSKSEDDILESFVYPFDTPIRVAKTIIHSHPPLPERIATDIPSDYDFLYFLFAEKLSSSIMLDRAGAHIFVRTRERMRGEPVPAADSIEKVVKEAKEKDQTSIDVQKRINSLINQYGIVYLYHKGLEADPDGNITFKRP